MTFLSFSLAFGLLAMLHVSWIQNSNFVLLCCQCTHQGKFSVVLPLSILCGESRLLVSWCAGDRCDMAGSNDDRGRSRRPGIEDRGWSSTGWVLGGRTIKRLSDAMCGLHRAQGDEEHVFLSLALKPRAAVSPGLASKPVAPSFLVWASESATTVW
jgi:hypothetical protein